MKLICPRKIELPKQIEIDRQDAYPLESFPGQSLYIELFLRACKFVGIVKIYYPPHRKLNNYDQCYYDYKKEEHYETDLP